jgi:streptogramin lyase
VYEGDAGTTVTVSPLNLTTTTFAFEGGQSSSSYAYASFTGTVTQANAPTNPAIANLAMLGLCPSPVAVTLTGAYETDDVNGKLLVTFTNSGTNHFTAGEQVTFGTGIPSPYDPFNGVTAPVSSLVLGSNQFSIELGTYTGNSVSANFTASVYPPANFGSSSAHPLQFVYVNEISTVAMAYAVAQFSAIGTAQNDGVHVGTSSTNLLGLQNAANNAGNLYDIQGSIVGTGGDGDTHIARAFTPAGNGQIPQKTLDTLGNILANCVDSANTYSATTAPAGTQSTQCATIFNNATSDGSLTGTKPNDTATAMFNIVTHPSGATSNPNFVSNLYNSLTGNAPYQPSVPTLLNDFVIGIKYTGSMFTNPGECSADSLGNEWCADVGANTLTKLSPLGVVLYTFTVSGGPFHTMVDPSNNVWVVSQTGNSVSEYTSAGVAVAGSPYTDSGGFSTPSGIVNDGNGNTFVVNYATSNLVTIQGSGTTATFATSSTTCSNHDTTSAADSLGYGWTSGGNGNQACRVSSNGTLAATVTGLSSPLGVDIDNSNRAWIPNKGNNTLAQITPMPSTAPYYTLATFSGGGLSGPSGVAIDGLGNVWVTNSTPYSGGSIYSVSEFTNAGVAITGAGGYQAGLLNYPRFASVDISGNIWFANYSGASVEEMVGLGAPVVRPKALAVKNGTLGTRP